MSIARPEPHRVIVGVNGSMHSVVALRWAADYALRTGAALLAVHIWPPSSATGMTALERDPADARRELDLTIEYALGAEADRVQVSAMVVKGRPGPVLVTMAGEADLLVVGSHGRGTMSRLVLGSVSQYCTRHAPCPVVVVPMSPETEAEHMVTLPVAHADRIR